MHDIRDSIMRVVISQPFPVVDPIYGTVDALRKNSTNAQEKYALGFARHSSKNKRFATVATVLMSLSSGRLIYVIYHGIPAVNPRARRRDALISTSHLYAHHTQRILKRLRPLGRTTEAPTPRWVPTPTERRCISIRVQDEMLFQVLLAAHKRHPRDPVDQAATKRQRAEGSETRSKKARTSQHHTPLPR